MDEFTSYNILICEDDDDDYLITELAFKKAEIENIFRVKDGEELLIYLKDPDQKRMPALIIMDLNMPRKDGRQALKEIRENRELCHIPVIVFTVSSSPDDILNLYKSGANSYVIKPNGFYQLVEIAKIIKTYWLQVVALPYF